MNSLIKVLFFFLFLTQISFGQWVQLGLDNESIKDIAARDSNIFAISLDSCDLTSDGIYCTGKGYRSTDGGTNWTMIVDSLAVDFAISPSGKVFMLQDTIYSAIEPLLYHSLDNGDNWQLIMSGGNFYRLSTITICPAGIVYCGILNCTPQLPSVCRDRFKRSDDDGLNWEGYYEMVGGRYFDFREQNVITIGYQYGTFAASGTVVYNEINISSDYGYSWSLLAANGHGSDWESQAIGIFTNNNIILNKYIQEDNINELYISSDMCSTWTKIAEINTQSGISLSNGSTEGMLIGTDSLGVFLFSDEGDSLGSKNEGLTNLNIYTLSLDNNGYVYAGTENGVWRRPLSEIVTSIEQEPTQPTEFILEQNFPNPFNPSTTIQYSIKERTPVELVLYDILGKVVEVLVNEEQDAGYYKVNFNAKDLASGIYLYRLKAGSFVETKKMLLIK